MKKRRRVFCRRFFMAACASVFLLAAWSTNPWIAGDNVDPRQFIQSLADQSLMIMGDNDELIFDGGSCMVGSDGKIVARAKSFEEDLTIPGQMIN